MSNNFSHLDIHSLFKKYKNNVNELKNGQQTSSHLEKTIKEQKKIIENSLQTRLKNHSKLKINLNYSTLKKMT